MREIQKQSYAFEDFESHISLWNIIPAGKGNSLVLLRKIIDAIQSKSLKRTPSLLIVGEGANTHALALANSLCSEDVRYCEGKYLFGSKGILDFFKNCMPESVFVISNPGTMGMSEGILWQILRKREYRFYSMAGQNYFDMRIFGTIILTSKTLKSVLQPLLSAVDHKVVLEPYTTEQLKLIVHQRLKFCGVNYGNCEEVLDSIFEGGKGDLGQMMDLLQICLIMMKAEGSELLTLDMVRRASQLG